MATANKFTVCCIKDAASLLNWENAWQAAFNPKTKIDSACSFFRLAGDCLYLSTFESGRVIYLVHQDHQLLALIALQLKEPQRFGPLTAVAANSGEHYVSDMLILPSTPNQALVDLFETVFRTHADISWIEFNRITEPALNRLVNFTTQQKRPFLLGKSSKHLSFQTADQTIDEYEKSLGKNTRHNMRRYWKRLANDHGEIKFNLIAPQSRADNNFYFERFLTLEASGWKGQEASAIESKPRSKRFHQHMTESATTAQKMLWATLTVNDSEIAMLLILNRGDKLWVVKTAYNENFKQYSPGGLVTHQLILNAIESTNIDEIDMITEYDWHRRWQPKENQYYSFRLFNHTLTAKLIRQLLLLKKSGWQRQL